MSWYFLEKAFDLLKIQIYQYGSVFAAQMSSHVQEEPAEPLALVLPM